MPQVSIIIPLYNKECQIARAIQSVRQQTFDDWQLIVVNDGSTDNGPEIVKGFQDNRITLIHQDNAGPGTARNTGLKASAGKYVVFLDADDEFMPDFLGISFGHLKSNPNCSLSVVDHFVSAEKIPWLTLKPELDALQGPWRLSSDISGQEAKSTVDLFQSGAVLCLRSIVLQYGGFYENGCTYGEDNYIWLQIILNHMVYIDRTPLIWHHTEDSELGDRRVGGYPPWPKLTDPQRIKQNCPEEYRNFLDQTLAYYAIIACKRCLQSGDMKSARWLINNYPMMSEWKKEYRKIKFAYLRKKLKPFFNR